MQDGELFERCYDRCRAKVGIHMANTAPEVAEVRECPDGNYYEHEPGFALAVRWNWLSSMSVGMPLLLADFEKDKSYIEWADKFYGEYDKKVSAYYTQTMHDLGFLYLPYSVMLYRLTGDEKHKRTALKAATELAKRFNVTGRFIEAWDEMNLEETERRMIIDALMNIPLLFWAWKETGHMFYRDVAKAHADTVLRVLVREDYSVKHAVFFNADGTVRAGANNCGYSDDSHWARGTAWAIYGFALAAKFTGEKRYLDAAEKIFAKYAECLGDGGKIPVWDFRLPEDKPAYKCREEGDKAEWDESLAENVKYNRDSSAAAVVGCAALELEALTGKSEYRDFAHQSLKELCEGYFDEREDVAGMLMRANGRNVYAIYGDYYFLQLLLQILSDGTQTVCI